MDPKPQDTKTNADNNEHKDTENSQNNVSSSNADSIHYQDGLIQKKVYGGENADSIKQIYVHLIEKTKMDVHTLIVNAELQLTVGETCTLLEEKNKVALNSAEVKTKLDGQAVDSKLSLEKLFIQKTQQKPELFIFYDETKAIIKEKVSEAKYQPITKYSFLDDKKVVKVYVQLEGIGKVPAQNIHSRFLQWSIQVKINDYKGKNWIFAVPKTQCLLKPKQSKVIQKENKLIISIAKNAQADNWFSLYKVKCVGERGDD